MSVFSPRYGLRIIKIRRLVKIIKKKKILIAFVSLFIIFTISLVVLSQMNTLGSYLSHNFSKEKVRIGHMGKTENILYYLANDLGYFEEEGIQSELVLFDKDEDGIAALLSGDIDTGAFTTMEVIFAMDSGQDLKIFGGGLQHGYGLFTKKANLDQGASLENYIGKSIGTVKNSVGDVILRYSINKLDKEKRDQISIVEFDYPRELIVAIKGDTVDSGVLALSDVNLEDRKDIEVDIASINLFKKHPSYSQIARASLLGDKDNEKFLIRYQRALIRAYKYYLENPMTTSKIVSNYVYLDKETIMADIYDGDQGANWENFWPNPNPNKEYYEKLIKVLEDLDYISSSSDKKRRYVYDAIYFKAMNELAKETNDPVYKKLQRQFLC